RCVVISDSGCTASRSTTDESTVTEAPEDGIAAETAAEEEKGETKEKEVTTEATVKEVEVTTEQKILTEVTTEKELCPIGYFGNVAHPELCNSFFMCTAGIANQLFCNNGYEFDPIELRCVDISDTGCTASRTPIDTQEKAEDDGYRRGEEYETESTSKEAGTMEKQLCPIGYFGNVAHPTQCNSFYMCIAGAAIHLHCFDGFEFDPQLNSCVTVSQSGCFATRG
ncbi:Protein AC150, partial [Eumeta japonica]